MGDLDGKFSKEPVTDPEYLQWQAELARNNAAARLALPYKKRMGQALQSRRWEDVINNELDQIGGFDEGGKKKYDDSPTSTQKLRDSAEYNRRAREGDKGQRVPPEILLENLLGGQDPRSPMYHPKDFTSRSEEDI